MDGINLNSFLFWKNLKYKQKHTNNIYTDIFLKRENVSQILNYYLGVTCKEIVTPMSGNHFSTQTINSKKDNFHRWVTCLH